MRSRVAVVLLILASVASAAERQWQTGTWTDVGVKRQFVDFGPGSSGFGPPNAGLTMRALADVRTYVIETADLRLELRDVVQVGRRSVEVHVGSEVTFALDKSTVYVRDSDGTEHKLHVTKKVSKRKS
jgi:hypothetical protein